MNANEIGNDAIRNDRVQVKDENRETIEQLLDDIKKEKVRLQLDRLNTHKSNIIAAGSGEDNDATIIKNTLSPYSAIVSRLYLYDDVKFNMDFKSITEALSEIVNLVESVNYLSKKSVENVCTDIRDTLEKLAKKWESSLNKQNIPIPQDIPEYHDGIDNVIQSVDALRGNCTIYSL